jgi:alginate O-acetyltransferase complex protein AlgI
MPKLRDYLMFASFFPQLVAGRIVRPKYFVPQMTSKRTLTLADVKGAMYLFLLGYVKKVCIADNVSPFVDRVFNNPAPFQSLRRLRRCGCTQSGSFAIFRDTPTWRLR